jgi:hypothetical protein
MLFALKLVKSSDSTDEDTKVVNLKRQRSSNIIPKIIQNTLDAGGSLVPMSINLKLSSLYNVLKVRGTLFFP